MIVCPACHAENPDGTKICVKCGTELPKVAAAKAKAESEPQEGGYQARDLGRDLVELLWLFLIILLVCGGFWGELTHWTGHLTERQEAKMVAPEEPVKPAHHARGKAPKKPMVSERPVELGSPEGFYKKGQQQYDAHHYQASFDYLKKALEIDPTYAKAYFALGYLYSRFDMDDPAVRMYKMSLRFDPNNAQVMNNLGMHLKREGNYEEAMPLFQKAVEADGQNADYLYDLGDAYLDQSQYPEALEHLKRASELKPEDAAIYDDIAISYEKMGKREEALEAWQKVAQYSKSPDLTQNAQTHIQFLQTKAD
ncbi:MAG TPA: tetratricopeptide repeat protein [bacterium]|nr:tetratricopeptide repeat protein [bacterium]